MVTRFLDVASLIVLLAIVGLRPLVTETFHTSGLAGDLAPGLSDPFTSHTLLINIAILLIAFRATLKRAISKRHSNAPTGIEIGAGVLLIAALVACASANDKRPAILSGIDLFGAIALVWSLVCLIDRSWKRTLLLMVVCASGMVSVAGSFDQAFVTMAESEKQYEETREAMWADQGVALDSPQVQMFESRMRSREATGYFSHSNIAGGYLLLILFSMLATARFAWSTSPQEHASGLPILLVLLALTTAGGIYLSRSNGAMAAGLVMLLLLGIVLVKLPSWQNHRAQVFRFAVVLIVVAIVGVCLFGLSTGGLPGASLDFRWQYWEVSSRILGDHWATGVGPENFGDAYLQYKTIANSEEVKNPHNLLVQFATEYGLLGLIGAVLVLFGGAKAYAQSRTTEESIQPDAPASEAKAYVASAIMVGLLMFAMRYLMLPSRDPNYVVWSMIMSVPLWILVMTLGAFVVLRLPRKAPQDSTWIMIIGFGLAAFLLQDAINFALFVPGARTTFAAVFAATLVRRRNGDDGQINQPTRWIAPVVILVTLTCAVFTASSVIPAEMTLARARQLSSTDIETAHAAYLEAERQDPLDAAIPYEHSKWLLQLGLQCVENEDCAVGAMGELRSDAVRKRLAESLQAVDEAIARAPNNHALHRLKSKIHMYRYYAGIPGEDDRAFEALSEALRLYPSRPMTHVELADCFREDRDCEALERALDHLNRALQMDAERPQWEVLRRFNPRIRAEIDDRVQNIKQFMRENACEYD